MLSLKENLPHLYKHKLYKWQDDFINSLNKMNLVCAGNQSGKSSCNLIRCIDHATDISKWEKLWDLEKTGKPNLFWYLYPDKGTATIEFETKWKKYLPMGEYKNHPTYGWKEKYQDGKIHSVSFNSGVVVIFKTHEQKETNIQGNTVFEIFIDEELPESRYDEVQARLIATNGYFNMVFTATIGQEIWRKAIEEKGVLEMFKGAFKQQVSLYDCTKYKDGSPGMFTEKSIIEFSNKLRSENEILKRVHGRFVLDAGLVYESFLPSKNICAKTEIPADYSYYAGIDIGSGGKNHASSIVILATSPDFKKGYITDMWKGDQFKTNEMDVVRQYKSMTRNIDIKSAFYDYAAKDFEIVAQNNLMPIVRAEKSHDIGEGILNVLFKNQMLYLFDCFELPKFIAEIKSLRIGTLKHKANDDLLDAVRYACAGIPWNLSDVRSDKVIKIQKKYDEREKRNFLRQEQSQDPVQDEIDFWNDSY